jgi:hypothetical protein
MRDRRSDRFRWHRERLARFFQLRAKVFFADTARVRRIGGPSARR